MTSRTWTFVDLEPRTASLRDDVLHGLARSPRSLPPKYFYDARGSELFERICRTPEYYPTRTEMQIMRVSASEMARRLGPGCALVEYGSGSGLKTRVLLQALRPIAYLPIDISVEPLKAAAESFSREFPDIRVTAVRADYTDTLDIPALGRLPARQRAVYFSGSTIGNFTPDEARIFLLRAHALLGKGGAMLVGVDLHKDATVLNAAYNDAEGITAQFNLNLLERLNRELGADFDLGGWLHRAFYDADLRRIEMHLVSTREQKVAVGSESFRFLEGETIHTENSYKYTVETFQSLARSAGFSPKDCWTDEAKYFSVHYLIAV